MQVNLSWASVPNALYYNVFRGTSSGGPYQWIAQSNPNPGQSSSSGGIVTTFQDGPANLVNGQDYFYVISTVTIDGESPYSAEIPALAFPQPPNPQNPVAVLS
jgi:hypothetical protein